MTVRRAGPPHLHVLAAALPILAACLGGPACAQFGASLSLASDYRVRGLSLSDRRPTLSLNLSYDLAGGAYFGASAIGADTAHSGLQAIGYQEYVGYAARTAAGPGWDVGVSNANFTEYFRRRYNVSYSEIYVGVTTNNVSYHVYYSPDYLGEGVATVYFDVDGVIRPAPKWRLFGHVGLLAPLAHHDRADLHGPQYDLRIGAARTIGRCELQLAWTSVGPDDSYLADRAQPRDALVLSAAYAF